MVKRTKSRFVALCRAEIGYHEKETNSNLYDKTANKGDKNYTKYAVENAKAGMYNGNKNGFPYCDVFYDNMMLHLCDMDRVEAERRIFQTGDLGAGVRYSANYYKQAGRFHVRNPQVGDQIFLYDYGHTGAVVEVNGDTIKVVEGNTSHNCVEEKKYYLCDPMIDGFGRPIFDEEEEEMSKYFKDVKSDSIYAEAIDYCKENGLMQGTNINDVNDPTDDEFNPEGTVTREQLAMVLARLHKKLAEQ